MHEAGSACASMPTNTASRFLGALTLKSGQRPFAVPLDVELHK